MAIAGAILFWPFDVRRRLQRRGRANRRRYESPWPNFTDLISVASREYCRLLIRQNLGRAVVASLYSLDLVAASVNPITYDIAFIVTNTARMDGHFGLLLSEDKNTAPVLLHPNPRTVLKLL